MYVRLSNSKGIRRLSAESLRGDGDVQCDQHVMSSASSEAAAIRGTKPGTEGEGREEPCSWPRTDKIILRNLCRF